MIWPICFISLTHLFEIRLYSLHIDHPIIHQDLYLSWADNSHNRLSIETNISNVYIEKCYNKVKDLFAICSITKRDFKRLYECHRAQRSDFKRRLKRNVDSRSKRSLYLFLLFVIGISGFVIGILIGIIITIFIPIQRQKRDEQSSQQRKANTTLEYDIKSFNINDEVSKRLYVFC